MKPFALILLFFAAAACTSVSSNNVAVTQETTTLFFVRHAEKADDGTQDPPLNDDGVARAEALALALKDAEISAIYSTPYKRTKETAAVLASARSIGVKEYQPHDKGFILSLVESENGNAVLVVGHSNTVPAMVNELIGEQKLTDLQESEYDFLYMVQLGRDTTLTVLHYGMASRKAN